MHNDEMRKRWDRLAEAHAARKNDTTHESAGQLYQADWWQYISPLLTEIPNGRILEAGCGTGRWAEHLIPMGFSVVMSDFSPAMLAKAKEYAGAHGFAEKVTFKELDVCDMHSLDNDSFDMVISTGEPISLCSDPHKAIREYCRVVKPGGYVLCDAANKYRRAFDTFRDDPSDRFLHILESGKDTAKHSMRLHLFGPTELTSIFEELGMEVCTLAGITPLDTFPPSGQVKKAMKNEAARNALYELSRRHGEKPEIVALSSRILAVAHKPK